MIDLTHLADLALTACAQPEHDLGPVRPTVKSLIDEQIGDNDNPTPRG